MSSRFTSPAEALHRLRTYGNRLIDGRPFLEGVLLPIRDQYAKTVVEYTRLRNRRRHRAPIDPYRLHWVDPSRIDRSMSWQCLDRPQLAQTDDRFHAPHYRLAGKVMPGDWDRAVSPFEESAIYESFRAHFIEAVQWEATDLFDQCCEAIKRGSTPWGCSTATDLQRRFAAIDRLYSRMATDGYRTQGEIIDHGLPDPLESARSNAYARTIEGEIAVNVGRRGELLFFDGRNRLAIAKLLELDAVPVVILVRHRGWQRLRDAVADGETTKAALDGRFLDHPDLIDHLDGDQNVIERAR